MNGSQCLIETLLAHDITTVFCNPGTSEVGMVAEMANTDSVRAVPVLFEGIAAGAADGYYRMTGRPAATMLHAGPGLANAWSAIHNAAKAGSGILNIVGQLSEAHLEHESPLKSDILGLAASVSEVVYYPLSPAQVGVDALSVAVAARQGKIATLLMANDIGWSTGAESLAAETIDRGSQRPDLITHAVVDPHALGALRKGDGTLLLLGGGALDPEGQRQAAMIAAATGCSLMIEWANSRCERGGGLPHLNRIPYNVNDAVRVLAPFETIVLCGAREPIAFFNHRGSPSRLAGAGTTILDLQAAHADCLAALREASQELTAGSQSPNRSEALPACFAGAMPRNADTIGELIAAALPEDAIVVNEAITSVGDLFAASAAAARHTWLDNLGGSIGFALPVGHLEEPAVFR